MARPKNIDKEKESLENLGVKVEPTLKKAIEDESRALGIAAGTYSRQLVILGWQARHQAPVAKNPREQILLGWFNELPISEQENVLTMVEALHKKPDRTPTTQIRSPARKRDDRDDIDAAIDAALTYGGQPVTPENRQVVREMFERERREEELNRNRNSIPNKQTENKTGE